MEYQANQNPPIQYLVGVGSNAQAIHNVTRALESFAECFGHFWVSRALRTKPVGLVQAEDFINLVIFLETPWSPSRLKNWCLAREHDAGRDRCTAEGIRSVPLDLDMLAFSDCFDGVYGETEVEEPYYRAIARELLAYRGGDSQQLLPGSVILGLDGLKLGAQPTELKWPKKKTASNRTQEPA